MPRKNSKSLSSWSWVLLWIVLASVLWNDLRRLQYPVGEKAFNRFDNGQHDFGDPYLGARLLLAGRNPYGGWKAGLQTVPVIEIGGRHTAQVYPPAHLLLYVPLALVYGEDWEAAGQAWFVLCFGFFWILAFLCARVWEQTEGVAEPDGERELGPRTTRWILCLLILSTSSMAAFGLERGQSDVLTAVFVWAAVWLAVRERRTAAMMAVVAATSLKGYGLPLFPALLALEAPKASRRWTFTWLGGALLATLIAYALFPGFFWALRFRASGTGAAFDNHSFYSLGAYLSDAHALGFGRALLLVSAVASALAWWQAWQARRALAVEDYALWLSLFAACALYTFTSMTGTTYNYNVILALPGVWIAVVNHRRLVGSAPPNLQHLVGGLLLLVVVALFLAQPLPTARFPAVAFGMQIFLILVGLLALLQAPRGRTKKPRVQ